MNEYSNPHIYQLNGYLNCLSKLCGPRYFFGVSSYECESSIDSFASEIVKEWNRNNEDNDCGVYVYHKKHEVEYKTIRDEIQSYIFNGCINQEALTNQGAFEYATRTLIDDINESYGLVSTSLNKEGVFHPLITGPLYMLSISNNKNEKCLYYVVKIESMYVLTYFIIHAE